MKNLTLLSFCALTLGMAACINVSVSEPSVCDSQPVSFTEPADLTAVCQNTAVLTATGNTAYALPAQSTTTTFNFSTDLSKLDDVVSNLKLQVNQLLLDNPGNDLGFVSSVEVDMQGADATSFPSMVLATYTAPAAGVGSELDFVVNPDTNLILNYLKAGQVQLTITLNSVPLTLSQACGYFGIGSISSTVHMCVGVSGKFSKKL